MLNVPRRSAPVKRGDWYYYTANTGLQNQDVYYRTKDLSQEGEVFIDPNEWSEDGTVSIAAMSWSDDDSLLSYCISRSGSDRKEARFKRADAESDLTNPILDELHGIKFGSPTWTPSKQGVLYPRFPQAGDGTETTKNTDMELW